MSTLLPRSPYATVGGLVWFGRLVDKIRLAQSGQLPADYEQYRGKGLDGLFLKVFKVSYDAIAQRVTEGGTDDEILDWCYTQRPGGKPDEMELRMMNHMLSKLGWRDEYSERFAQSRINYKQQDNPKVQTYYDMLDADEGRLE